MYFDTEDRALAARGLALWITGEGGDTLAILESVRASEGLIADRSEWRVPIARPTPDLAAFSDSEARAFLDGLGSERLVAIGEGQIARSELTLGWPQRNDPQALLTVVFEQGCSRSKAHSCRSRACNSKPDAAPIARFSSSPRPCVRA